MKMKMKPMTRFMLLISIAFQLSAPHVFLGQSENKNENKSEKKDADSAAPQTPREGVDSKDLEKPKASDAPALLSTRNPRYRLRYGDIVDLKFPVTPEFNQRVTIQPDGFIPVIGLADLHVEGLTLDELVTALRKAYSSTLKDPEISVTLVDFEKPYFVVGGEVSKPGKYDMRGATSVAQAVTIAGGFSKAAKRSKVLLFRNISDEWVKVIKLDLGKMFNTADLTEDLQLNPGDMVYVSQSGFAKVREYLPRTDALIWWAIRGW